ncbi:hypothetical protein CB1_007724001 [Camelus ferus]|nr:hypothetical protein CB1_007724001 [Camelus ferus]
MPQILYSEAAHSTLGRSSISGLGEDCETAQPLLCAKTWAESAPSQHQAAHSTLGRSSISGLGEDCETAQPLLCAKTQLLVCLGSPSSLRYQGGKILSASRYKQVSIWPLRLLSP